MEEHRALEDPSTIQKAAEEQLIDSTLIAIKLSGPIQELRFRLKDASATATLRFGPGPNEWELAFVTNEGILRERGVRFDPYFEKLRGE